MKKAIAFIGSCRGNNSHTFTFTKLILDSLVKVSNNTIEYEIITSEDLKFNFCKGCCYCFISGECQLDNYDEMYKIKEKFINADIIILGSPVYAHSISSSTKLFIDRTSSWFHLFKLNNKISFSVSTSSTNGNIFVDNYLKKILEMYGTTFVNTFSCTTDTPACLRNDNFINIKIPKYAQQIYNALTNPDYFKSTSIQEELFKSLKSAMINSINKNIVTYETEYWNNSGLLSCNTYQEYLTLKNKNLTSIL